MSGHTPATHIFSLARVCKLRRELLRFLSPRHVLLAVEVRPVSMKERETFCPIYFVRKTPIMPCAEQPTQRRKMEEISLYLAQLKLALANEVAKVTLRKK